MSQRTINHYEISGQIGQGGMATVFRAYDPRFKREVALKLLPHALLHDPSFRVRFEREAQTIASLEHPAIVPVYDYGEADGQPYLVMRLMTGGTLGDRLAQGPLTVTEAARIFGRLAPALDAAHKQGIIHRDLKPGNILFDQWNEPYLADFGIAKLADGDGAKGLTATGSTMGTPAYMSPEQVQGDNLDGRSDVYALGVILFEMLTGKRPYEAGTPMAVALKHVMDPIPPLPKADLPPECQTIINKALAKAPDHRYASASALATDVFGLVGTPSQTIPVAAAEPHPATEVMMPTFAAKSAAATSAPISQPVPKPVAPPPAKPAPAAAATAPARGRSLPLWLFGGGGVVAIFLCLGLIVLAAVLMLPGDDDEATPTRTAVVDSVATPEDGVTDAAATPDTEPVPSDAGVVQNLDGVSQAVVQIVARGTFRDPELGTIYNATGGGSGFIIDPSGIIVTNNHVIVGAAILEVYVQGESTPRNARILGASECADLAIIAIDGQDLPYLTWYKGPIDVGLDIYAAGFPLGDPEFTLTRGTVSKADANGETGWASVTRVIEHDANLNPGNSGGPLVNSDGQVVGINYALASQTNQYFAIAANDAISILDQLREGQNLAAIGINGTAVSNGQGLTGIWVTGVMSGSPAGQAGVKAGDVITMLEGLILATDGTMSGYCNILRGHATSDVLSIEVLRYDTGQTLRGQLNGTPLQ